MGEQCSGPCQPPCAAEPGGRRPCSSTPASTSTAARRTTPSVAARSNRCRRGRRQVGGPDQVSIGEERLRLGQHGIRSAAAKQADLLQRRAIGSGAFPGRDVGGNHGPLRIQLAASRLAAAAAFVLGAQALRSHQAGRSDPRQQRIAVGQPIGGLRNGRLSVIEAPAGQRQAHRIRHAPVTGRGFQTRRSARRASRRAGSCPTLAASRTQRRKVGTTSASLTASSWSSRCRESAGTVAATGAAGTLSKGGR